MGTVGQRNLTFAPSIGAKLDAVIADFNKRCPERIWPRDVISAALVLFFDQSDSEQLQLLRRGKTYAIESVLPTDAPKDVGTIANAPLVPNRDCVLEDPGVPVRAAETTPEVPRPTESDKPSRRRKRRA
jgi:hypothetical protein